MRHGYRALLPVLVLYLCHPAFPQGEVETYFYQEYSYLKNSSVYSEYILNSNALTNEFVNAFILGKYIDDGIKDKVSAKLRPLNRLGFEFNTGVSFTEKTDTFLGIPHVNYTVSLRDRRHRNMQYTPETLELLLRGNAYYRGDTAYLAPLSYNLYHYQQLYFGLEKVLNRESGSALKLSGGLSLLKGVQYAHAEVLRGSLYTQDDGEYIDLDINFSARLSDTSNTSIWAFNGLGLSTDFSVAWLGPSKNILHVEVRDLGAIVWSSRSFSAGKDTSYHFEGVEIDNVFQISDSLLDDLSADSILDFMEIHPRYRAFAAGLPAMLHVYYGFTVKPLRTRLFAGVQYYWFANHLPRVYLRSIIHISKSIAVAPVISYGGYGNADSGFAFYLKFARSYLLTLSCDYLDGFISPSSATAQGVYLSLGRFFN